MTFDFQLIKPSELETLRIWRNHPHNAHWFEFKEEITPAAQIKWYERLDKENCWYFTYTIEGQIFAFFHLKRHDAHSKTAECGLITNPEIQTGSGAILQGSLHLLEFAFDKLELSLLRAKVHSSNSAALDYNQGLGFTHEGLDDKQVFGWMELSKERYTARKAHLTALCRHIG